VVSSNGLASWTDRFSMPTVVSFPWRLGSAIMPSLKDPEVDAVFMLPFLVLSWTSPGMIFCSGTVAEPINDDAATSDVFSGERAWPVLEYAS
jgi:hypothetical protein